MSVFTRLAKLPLYLTNYYPKPSYHPTKKNTIMISTDYEEISSIPGIYEYNLETNEINCLCDQIPRSLEEHGQFIDPENHILYLFGGTDTVFITFDLKNNEIECNDSILIFSFKPITTYIPSPINEIHTMRYKYISDKKCMVKLDISCNDDGFISDDGGLEYPHLLYVAIKQQLMIFGCNEDERIWHCDIQQNIDQKQYKWKLNTLRMPHLNESVRYDILLAFDSILFVFYFSKYVKYKNANSMKNVQKCQDIWCLDLKYNEWFKSQYQIPSQTAMKSRNMDYSPWNHVIKNGNYAHILNFEKRFHFKLNLHDIIPKELIKVHVIKYNEPLIIGYFKEKQNEYHINIPFALKQLILKYYPTFV